MAEKNKMIDGKENAKEETSDLNTKGPELVQMIGDRLTSTGSAGLRNLWRLRLSWRNIIRLLLWFLRRKIFSGGKKI